MDIVLCSASWVLAAVAVAAFGWLVMFGVRAARVQQPPLRRDVRIFTALAVLAGLLVQLALVPFYVRSAVGRAVRIQVSDVSSLTRGGYLVYQARGLYDDARRVRHVVYDRTSRAVYERWSNGSRVFLDFIVVDGEEWLDQAGSQPLAPGRLVWLGPLAWLALFGALRNPELARSLFRRGTWGRARASPR